MRSRIAITALLASGALLSSGGAAIGVTALSTTSDASQAQYGPVATNPAAAQSQPLSPQGDTLAGVDEGVSPASAPASSSGVKDAAAETTPTAAAQPARQLESDSGDTLPFTGYAAIALLLAGMALLVSGLVLRRSTTRRLT